MDIKRLILVGLVSLFFMAAPAQAGDKQQSSGNSMVMDMEEAVRFGLDHSPRVQAEEYGIRRSESEVKSVRGQFLPQASFGAGYTYLDSLSTSGRLPDTDELDQTQYQWNLQVVQTVFAGLTILSSYRKAQIEQEISEISKETAERELVREIQHHFLELLKAREDKRSLTSSIERLEVGLEASKSFYEKQLTPYVDVLQAEVELEEARQELIQAKNEKRIQRTQLNSLLGLDHYKPVQYRGDLEKIAVEPVFDSDQVLEKAMEQRTELQFLQKNMAATEQERRITRGEKMPRVNLEFNYTSRRRDYDDVPHDPLREPDDYEESTFWTAGATLEWNFFTGGQQYYQHEGLDYELRRLNQTLEDAKSSILSEARTAYLRLQEARERLVSARKALAAAGENYSMQEHRYKQRVGTITDLLTAQEHLTGAEVRKNQALLDYQQAMAEVYFAMGERNYALIP